ncbi:HesB/YadR/YfhF family protein [Peribacillus sp. NPDC096540]|uniref:HesB/YadR/YfhF family protein n=1 Tax=Peribacillus sp. NPDC096540 TaxID=3390612 RepID=UPI003D071C3C
MKLVISRQAVNWFKEEIELKDGYYVKFYARYGGSSPVQDGFSLGVSMDHPFNVAVQREQDGIVFFIEEADLWYFNGHDLHVEYKEDGNEIEYNYLKP